MKLTQKRLKELLYYDLDTGTFTWRMSRGNNTKSGATAGCLNNEGYIQIRVDDKSYRAARLAWLYMEGYFPENQIDHINRIRHDDRWINLRHVSHLCNMRNCNIAKNNTSGITGVCQHGDSKKWHAQIKIIDRRVFLGSFNSKIDAARARWNGEVKYGFPNCNTTSSAYLYLKERGLKC